MRQSVFSLMPELDRQMPRDDQSHPIRPVSSDYLSLDVYNYRGTPIAVGKTAFILPCHNEAADLSVALESIKNQVGVTVDTILVVSDNSTDDTVAIACKAGVSVIETANNRFKKAGALNRGIRYLMESGSLPEFIITGDGDTEYDQHFVGRALNIMRLTPRLGVLSAVCYGKTGLVSFPRWPSLYKASKHLAGQTHDIQSILFGLLCFFILFGRWTKAFTDYTLVWMQRAEYTRATMLRLRKNIHTMSGAGSVIRSKAAIDVLYSNVPPGVTIDWKCARLYREHGANLVEDFALTLDIKVARWQCTNNFYVVARTDLMRDFRSLFRQRTRWVRGTIDELRRRKFNRESRVSALTIIYGLTLMASFYVLNALALMVIIRGGINIMDFWMLPLMGVYQAIMVRSMGWKSMFIAFILIPETLYALMRHTWIITALGKSLSSTTQKWE